jgi:hypothetical protein
MSHFEFVGIENVLNTIGMKYSANVFRYTRFSAISEIYMDLMKVALFEAAHTLVEVSHEKTFQRTDATIETAAAQLQTEANHLGAIMRISPKAVEIADYNMRALKASGLYDLIKPSPVELAIDQLAEWRADHLKKEHRKTMPAYCVI